MAGALDGIRGVEPTAMIAGPLAHLLDRFAARDVPFASIYDIAEAAAEHQVAHLGSFFRLEHPTLGEDTAGILRGLGLGEGGQDRTPIEVSTAR